MTIALGFLLLLLSALFAGLTIGLMSLDVADLRRMANFGSAEAKRVLEIRKHGMLLLVTLLLGNATANSFFSILVGDHLSGFIAVTFSTVLIFLFGEVLPQAVLSRHALRFGATSAPLITILIKIFYPICGPIAFLLTKFLGEESVQSYTKRDIISIIDETDPNAGEFDHHEKRIVRGSLSFSERKAHDIMTPSTVVTTVELDDVITRGFLAKLKEIGYSRIPVEESDPQRIVGILYYKDLVGIRLPVRVQDLMEPVVHFVNSNDSLDQILSLFLETKKHLFVVTNDFGGFDGVVTLEDIIEEIIGTEIMDEGDEIADLRKEALRKKEELQKLSQKSHVRSQKPRKKRAQNTTDDTH